MRTPLSLPTKVVLTGGTSGIGAEMLAMLLADGHQVVVLARRASQLEPHSGMEPIDIDLSDLRAVKAVATDIAVRHPDATVLINNAALQYPVALTDPDFDTVQMEAEVTINLLAPALLVHAMLPGLQQQGAGAAIVNVSSGLAFFPKQQAALYSATKAALHSFSQSLRYQLEADGVAVIEAILPMVETPMTQGRGSGKISARDAAIAILSGTQNARPEIHIGKAKLLPFIARLAPALGRKIMRGS
jgi:uncharacterized oxidoreductase